MQTLRDYIRRNKKITYSFFYLLMFKMIFISPILSKYSLYLYCKNVAFGLLNAIKRTFFISICCSIFARVGEKDKKMVLNGKVK